MSDFGLSQLVIELERRMDGLEDTKDPTYSQQFELAVVYFQLSEVYKRQGRSEEATHYKVFAETEMKELTARTNNDPIYLKQRALMYEYFGEDLPKDLAAALSAHTEKKQQAQKKKGFFARIFDSSDPVSENGIECETMHDAINNLGSMDRSLELRSRKSIITARNQHEDIAYAIERAIVAGMVVASLDDQEFTCGVERDYLETILPPEELADIGTLRERVLSGEIDLSQMPSHFRLHDFGSQVLVAEEFITDYQKDQRRLAYINAKLADVKDLREREALEVIKAQLSISLGLKGLVASDADSMISQGHAIRVEGPTDLGTSNERKLFYFWGIVTRKLRDYYPGLASRLGESPLGLMPATEDVYAGREYLLGKIPVLRELEEFGVLNMARALTVGGYEDVRTAVRGLISTSEGTPYAPNASNAKRLLKRVVDTATRLRDMAEDAILESERYTGENGK